jgi:hypothetical protein
MLGAGSVVLKLTREGRKVRASKGEVQDNVLSG